MWCPALTGSIRVLTTIRFFKPDGFRRAFLIFPPQIRTQTCYPHHLSYPFSSRFGDQNRKTAKKSHARLAVFVSPRGIFVRSNSDKLYLRKVASLPPFCAFRATVTLNFPPLLAQIWNGVKSFNVPWGATYALC